MVAPISRLEGKKNKQTKTKTTCGQCQRFIKPTLVFNRRSGLFTAAPKAYPGISFIHCRIFRALMESEACSGPTRFGEFALLYSRCYIHDVATQSIFTCNLCYKKKKRKKRKNPQQLREMAVNRRRPKPGPWHGDNGAAAPNGAEKHPGILNSIFSHINNCIVLGYN